MTLSNSLHVFFPRTRVPVLFGSDTRVRVLSCMLMWIKSQSLYGWWLCMHACWDVCLVLALCLLLRVACALWWWDINNREGKVSRSKQSEDGHSQMVSSLPLLIPSMLLVPLLPAIIRLISVILFQTVLKMSYRCALCVREISIKL